MKIKVRFPVNPGSRNHKAIREAILLDSVDNGFERKILAAADAAKSPDQETFVSRSYGAAGRFSVWIVDQSDGDRMDRRKGLQAALGRVAL